MSGSPPRRIRITATAIFVRVLVLSLLAGALILTPINAWNDINGLRKLASMSLPINGTVTGRSYRPTKFFTIYYIDYAYRVGANSYQDRERVTEAQFRLIPDHSAFGLMYVPNYPSEHFVSPITDETIQESISNWILRLLLIVGPFVGFCLANEISLRRQSHLLSNGIAARAIVVDMQAKRGNWGPSVSSVSHRITCRYWTGYEEVMKSFYILGDLYSRINIGDSITVLYDRVQPTNCVPFESISDVLLANIANVL